MTTPSERNGERLAVVENEVKHLRQDLTEHREESKVHAENQAKATQALSQKMSDYQNRLAIVTGVFMAVVAIFLTLPKLADFLRELIK